MPLWDGPEPGAAVLLAALESDLPETRLLAARSLLTDTFFYLLDETRLDAELSARRSSRTKFTWPTAASGCRPG